MTKKTKIVYVYLALFAFTLGFSFTLASRTQAEPDPFAACGCCVTYCLENPEQIEVIGHNEMTKSPVDSSYFVQCVGTYNPDCGEGCEHFTYLCGPVPD
jgi:hypothetical protein